MAVVNARVKWMSFVCVFWGAGGGFSALDLNVL